MAQTNPLEKGNTKHLLAWSGIKKKQKNKKTQKPAEFALLWPERMCQHSKSPGQRISGSGWHRLTVQKRGSWKRVSLLTRCALSAGPGAETPANSSKPGSCCHLPASPSPGRTKRRDVSRCPAAAGPCQGAGSTQHCSEHP